MTLNVPVALTIAGSDPSGGAGIQADLKTFHQFGVYGEAAITLITVQNTHCLDAIHVLDPKLVRAQIEAVVSDIPPRAAKTGALGNQGVIEAVADAASAFSFPLVVDPVVVGKHGIPLVELDAIRSLCTKLLPRAFLLTPNLPEAEALTAMEVRDLEAMREAARRLSHAGAKNVLLKGGHLAGPATDILLSDGEFYEFPGERVATRHTHGTGCTYSAAITAELAKGTELPAAVALAKQFIQEAIRTAPGLGHGAGPINHFALSGQ